MRVHVRVIVWQLTIDRNGGLLIAMMDCDRGGGRSWTKKDCPINNMPTHIFYHYRQ